MKLAIDPWLVFSIIQGPSPKRLADEKPIPTASQLMTWLRVLQNWLATRGSSRPDAASSSSPLLSVVIYTRTECHLCELAKQMLEGHREQLGLMIIETDIDGDPVLQSRYRECVPVVEIEGKERFRGRINAALLERTLRGELVRRRRARANPIP